MCQKSLSPTFADIDRPRFPSTKFMGSKRKILPFLFGVLDKIQYETVLDAFSGSGCVAFEFKRRGKAVTTNDFLYFSYLLSKALIENNNFKIDKLTLAELLKPRIDAPSVVRDLYTDIFFTAEECSFLDSLRINIEEKVQNPYSKALAISAACRACQKKRPRGIFTFTGRKSWDSRKDLKMSMQNQFEKAVGELNDAVFDSGKINKAQWNDITKISDNEYDLVYMDPPYWSPLSDNDYVRRYHFLEGYSLQWKGLDIDMSTKVRKFKSYKTPFSERRSRQEITGEAFSKVF